MQTLGLICLLSDVIEEPDPFISLLSQMSFIRKLAPVQGSTVTARSFWLHASSPTFGEGDDSPSEKEGSFFQISSILISQNCHLPSPEPLTPSGGWSPLKGQPPDRTEARGAPQQTPWATMACFKCSERTGYLSGTTHNSAIRLFGPNCLINKSVRLPGGGGGGWSLFILGGWVFWFFGFLVLGLLFGLAAP